MQSDASKRLQAVFVAVAKETEDMNDFVNAVVDGLAFSLAHIENSAQQAGVDLTAADAMEQMAETALRKAAQHMQKIKRITN